MSVSRTKKVSVAERLSILTTKFATNSPPFPQTAITDLPKASEKSVVDDSTGAPPATYDDHGE